MRFVQLYHTNWDSHGGPGENLQSDFEKVCRDVDQGQAALIRDLKARGLLKDTLVIWGGEFGRTPMGENRDTTGRNHHIDAFTMWLAGGVVAAGDYRQAPTSWVSIPLKTACTSTTCTRRSCTCWDWTKKLTFRFQGRDLAHRRPRRDRNEVARVVSFLTAADGRRPHHGANQRRKSLCRTARW